MKTLMAFDTLAYANQLKAAGVPAVIAEAHATANLKMMEGFVENALATKKDITELEFKLESKIAENTLAMKKDIADLESKIHGLETRLTIRLGGIVVGGLGVFTAISSFLHLAH